MSTENLMLKKEIEETAGALLAACYRLGEAYAEKYTPETADPAFAALLDEITGARAKLSQLYFRQAENAGIPAEEADALPATSVPEPTPAAEEIPTAAETPAAAAASAPEEIPAEAAPVEAAPAVAEAPAAEEPPVAAEAPVAEEAPAPAQDYFATQPIAAGVGPFAGDLQPTIPLSVPAAEPEEAEAEAEAEAPAMQGAVRCPQCNAVLEPDAAFCYMCGYALKNPAANEPPQQTADVEEESHTIPVGADPILSDYEDIPKTMPIDPALSARMEAMQSRAAAPQAAAEPFTYATPTGAGNGPRQCPNCGNLLNPGDRFCGFCSWRVEPEAPAGNEPAEEPAAAEDPDKTIPAFSVEQGGYAVDWKDEPTLAAGIEFDDDKTVPAPSVSAGGFVPDWDDEPTIPVTPTPAGFVPDWESAKNTTEVCPKCGIVLPLGATFCSNCGLRLDAAEAPAAPQASAAEAQPQQAPAAARCPQCGEPVGPDMLFCEACGFRLQGSTPPAPQTPAPAKETAPVCPKCGSAVAPGAVFCETCGCRLDQPQFPAPAPAVPEEKPQTPPAPAHTCPQCGAPVAPEAVFCENCGFKLSAPQTEGSLPDDDKTRMLLRCPGCGKLIDKDMDVCPGCGKSLVSRRPAPETPPLPPVRQPSPAVPLMRFCPNCGSKNESDARFCSECGHTF